VQGSHPLGRLIRINAVPPARVVPPARARNLLGVALCALLAVGLVTATGEATPDLGPAGPAPVASRDAGQVAAQLGGNG
jgi:hypothetical protein